MHKAVVALAVAASVVSVPSPSPGAQLVVVLLTVGASHETGRVVLVDVPAAAPVLRVSMALVGEPRRAVQPAYIRHGACASRGPTLRRLASAYRGESVTILPGFGVRQLIAAHASFEVHRSVNDATVVACGAIS